MVVDGLGSGGLDFTAMAMISKASANMVVHETRFVSTRGQLVEVKQARRNIRTKVANDTCYLASTKDVSLVQHDQRNREA